MKYKNRLLASALIGALVNGPVFASNDNDDSDDNYGKRYKEHYMQRHEMSMDMMQMLAETMTILRDLDHRPSAAEKKQLNEMIERLDEIMKTHADMGDRAMERMDRHMKNRDGHRNKRWDNE